MPSRLLLSFLCVILYEPHPVGAFLIPGPSHVHVARLGAQSKQPQREARGFLNTDSQVFRMLIQQSETESFTGPQSQLPDSAASPAQQVPETDSSHARAEGPHPPLNTQQSFTRTQERFGQSVEDQCTRSVDVAIVGARPSGTYSAYRLREAGLNIELFEYSDRIGGRLNTRKLPDVPDLNLEMGGMRFIHGVHQTVERLAKELGLTPEVFPDGLGKNARFFLRGQSLTADQIKYGDVPYNLSPEEKANQARISSYYLEKLTGFNESVLPRDKVLSLRIANGTELYKLRLVDALKLVATSEGQQFIRDISEFETVRDLKGSAVNIFNENLGEYSVPGQVLTLAEGMSAIPRGLAEKFVNSSSRHKISYNKKLDSIKRLENRRYQLMFSKTHTQNGFTNVTGFSEQVCATRAILAIPQAALTELDWEPLHYEQAREALHAVKSWPANRVYMTFSEAWWLSNKTRYPANVTESDLAFSHTYNWKQSKTSGLFAMIASYADGNDTEFLEKLNLAGTPIDGSAPGANRVTNMLKDVLLDELTKAFNISRNNIPDPKSAISQWWTTYPFGGGWTMWRPGFNFTAVRMIVRRPSLHDSVFIVGSDHAFGSTAPWTEGGLDTVDEVINAYFG